MEKLSNQPLIEVAFELYWKNMKNPFFDPNYQILIGAFYEQIKDKFPEIESLPTASIPPEVLYSGNRLVQYRFWSKGKTWPVIQLGPGILTINMNKNYKGWNIFKETIINTIQDFTEVYPDTGNLAIEKLILRYLNGFSFNSNDYLNILEFLSNYLHIHLNIDLGESEEKEFIEPNPSNINLALTYRLHKPLALLNLKLFKGNVDGKERLLLEILATSNENKPINDYNINTWLEEAHKANLFIFKSLISGKLEEELK